MKLVKGFIIVSQWSLTSFMLKRGQETTARRAIYIVTRLCDECISVSAQLKITQSELIEGDEEVTMLRRQMSECSYRISKSLEEKEKELREEIEPLIQER
jgi:hypothetical protein